MYLSLNLGIMLYNNIAVLLGMLFDSFLMIQSFYVGNMGFLQECLQNKVIFNHYKFIINNSTYCACRRSGKKNMFHEYIHNFSDISLNQLQTSYDCVYISWCSRCFH